MRKRVKRNIIHCMYLKCIYFTQICSKQPYQKGINTFFFFFFFFFAVKCIPTTISNWGKLKKNWGTTWQNQQNECVPSEDSDQPGHPPGLINVFVVRMKKAWVLSYPLSAQRRLIRLGGCPGWSESSLGALSLCWFCHVAAQLWNSIIF